MKKQTLLALSAGIAITASGLTFANTQPNSFQSGSQGTTITGSSDQGNSQNDQTVTSQGQTQSTNGNFKKKIADTTCGKDSKDSKDEKDKNSNDQSSDETTQKS